MIAGLIEEAAERAELRRPVRPMIAAKAVVAQLEGLVLFAKLANDPSQLDHLWEQTLLLLGAGEHPSVASSEDSSERPQS